MTGDRPRHSRKEIRDFADWLDSNGWSYEGRDSNGHTEWSHPRAVGRYRLPETPRHFDVRRARRDVLRMLGIKAEGKRNSRPKAPGSPRRDFALEQAVRQAQERERARAAQTRRAEERPVPTGPAVSGPRRVPKRLPWEDQPDDYDRGIDRMMRETPGRRS